MERKIRSAGLEHLMQEAQIEFKEDDSEIKGAIEKDGKL